MNALAPLDKRPRPARSRPTPLETLLATDPAFRGVGPARAATLADAFGSGLHAALAGKDARIVALLGETIAAAVFEAYEDRAAEAALLAWLEARGLAGVIDTATLLRIARCWGPEGAEALMANPCELVAFLPWPVVDRVRAVLGVPDDDPRRVAAAVEAVLYARLNKDHTWTSRAETEAGAAKLLHSAAAPVGRPGAPSPVACALATGVVEPFEDGVQPLGAAAMEAFLAAEIARLSRSAPVEDLATPPVTDGDLDDALAAFDLHAPHPLTPAQGAAVRLVFRRRLSLLAGYAGSGKTASLRAMAELSERFGRRMVAIALSGRAAQRMAQATGQDAMTIARFLRLALDPGAIDLGPGAIVVIDEASMVDLPTFWRIVRRLGRASLVMVGDPAQLPPIGFGLTFHALVEDPCVPRTVLDRVLRQAQESGIPAAAEALRFGRPPPLGGFAGRAPGVSFVDACPGEAIDAILEVGTRLAAGGLLRGDAQIVSPVKSGPAGVAAINVHCHALRRARGAPPLFPGRADIAEGDPVIWTRNDHERNLMNGSMGRILAVAGDRARAEIDGVERALGPADGAFLDLAYAITVHKAQGSQWPVVIVPVFASRVLDRTLVYTAATRAAEQVVFVGDRDAFEAAVLALPKALGRETTLGTRLRSSWGSDAAEN